jgi:tetratricopeptide (TPR) repeat protein
MKGLFTPLLMLVATVSFCVAMYRVFSRDYQYLQFIKMGDQLLEEELPFQAARAYGSAVVLRPDKPLGYLKRAEAHQVQGDLAHALEDLLAASELSPDVVTVSRRLADTYFAREDFDEAARYYSQVSTLDPDSSLDRYRLGMSCYRAGREAEAIEALTAAIALQKDFAQAYYLRAAIYRSLDQLDEAETDLLQALALRPEIEEARSALIDLYLQRKQTRKALKYVEEEIDKEPQDPMPYLHLADVHRTAGRHDEAIEAVNLALEQDPNLPEAYMQLGELWLEEGMRRGDHIAFDKAITALDSAAKMNPDSGRAALALGRACLAVGDEERAFSELGRAAEATPIQAEAHRLLGDLYQARGDYAEAITAYHIYLKLKGEIPAVLEQLGDAYLASGNIETAIATYLQLIELEPRRATPYIKAAGTLIQAGESRAAERICRRGLSSNPQNEALQSILAQLVDSVPNPGAAGTNPYGDR